MNAGPSIPLVLQYEPHPITDRFREMTFYPLARSIEPAKEPKTGIAVTSLFKSNPQSWAETDVNNSNATFDEKKDVQGPLSMAAAVEKEIKPAGENTAAVKARMVVVGNSDFAINAYFGMQGNGNLFMNMVSWLAQEEDPFRSVLAPEDRKIMPSKASRSTAVGPDLPAGRCACRGHCRLDSAEEVKMRFKGTLLLLLICLGVGGFLYFYEIKGGDQRTKAKEGEKVVWKVPAGDVQQIELISPADHITSVRAGENQWRITAPRALDADSEELNRLVSSASDISREDIIEENATDLARFGLEPPQSTVAIKTKDG
jgi:hypothetical protein